MIRVVHLFNIKPGVHEASFIEWLDAKLEAAAKQFGCRDRKTWILLDGFTGPYTNPKPVKERPKYVNEAYWTDAAAANRFRDWLLHDPTGKQLHDQWFRSIENHTLLRYVEGWAPVPMEG
ncbi:MAG: hypothetical protein HY561_12950 [Gemmatimonadetes bacterium]|nr:hypothetical protein [Gemmatimonadota bacterium]